MADVKKIIAFIDRYLEESGDEEIRPPEANKLLEKAGLLKDNTTRSGKPLRDILRRKLIRHAYQRPPGKYGRWHIPHSPSSSKSTILDHIANFSVSGDVFSKPANEYWALICLKKGLRFLNHQVAKCEENVKQQYDPSQIKLTCFGNDPLLAEIPQTLLTCAFHWYAISACQYVRTVGMIKYKKNSCVNGYIREVIPEVLSFRNKVAAHFAWTKSDSRDNKAERMISIMPQLTFENDSFFVGSFKLTSRRSGEKTNSEAIKPWSVTKTHECLCRRYWPTEAF